MLEILPAECAKAYRSAIAGQQLAISEMPGASVSKRGLVRNLSYEIEFDLHENSERFRTSPPFETEAPGISEMALPNPIAPLPLTLMQCRRIIARNVFIVFQIIVQIDSII